MSRVADVQISDAPVDLADHALGSTAADKAEAPRKQVTENNIRELRRLTKYIQQAAVNLALSFAYFARSRT